MANKIVKDHGNLSVEQLTERIKEQGAQLTKLQFEHGVKGIQNPMQLRAERREYARLMTEQRKRELVNVDPASRNKIRARRRRNK